MQYNSWPTNYTYPDCEDQFICEDNIYLSIPITTGHNYFANDFVIVDAETTLSSNNQVVFQADNFIQLNPGFNSNLSGNANIEFKIGNCTNEYELKQQPDNCIQLESITSN